jgi:DNA mismatch repair protein MutL
MGGVIQILNEAIANRIAAGEVVERPASVVKELIENALDAGARNLELDLEEGGIALVRLRDDGVGMSLSDLSICVLSHATSKIREVEDLFRISSFGFRGEALPSIASVSDTAITSRQASEPTGNRLSGRGGVMENPVPAGAPVGTTVEVRNLFHNVPARRKFLKQERTELGQCLETVTRLLLPEQEVAIRVQHNGKRVLEVKADTDLRERVRTFFGRDLADALIPVRRELGSSVLEGLIGPPSLVKSNSRLQYFFLNGRFIRDRAMGVALSEGYRGLIMPKDFPVAFLCLHMDPGEVDVNVHPTKTEVRFRDRDHVFSLVRSGVRDSLLASEAPAPLKIREEGQPRSASPSEGGVARYDLLRNLERELFERPSEPQRYDGVGRVPEAPLPLRTSSTEDSSGEHKALICSHKGRGPRPEATTGRAPRFMQIHRSYILLESDDGLRILDQHALHERKLYEELLLRFQTAQGEDQPLLVPEVLDLGARDQALVLDHQAELAALGIQVDAFGPTSLAIRSMPAILKRTSGEDLVEQILEIVTSETRKLSREEFLRATAANLACRAAVKFNDHLDPQEIEALLKYYVANPDKRNCPHGRPIAMEVTLKELELQFQRKK